ncbi:MAG: replicative DNA helicase [Syntrophales bacterium]|jgi:replicative DNA helicase|nr:replicative DNA helicase [Syntrophales bacterium]MCK9527424.1 replicative DNA helicase [Syntrophales bacterium]MDX9921526.1 replicative DNA helicase [Syntrophales bacterium]
MSVKKDVDYSLHKIPPQNLDAEQSVLGGMLLDNHAINAVVEVLDAGDFYSEAHRRIYTAILELFERNEPSDLVTLSNILRDKKEIDRVGGEVYLVNLVDRVPSAANIVHYAKIVKEKSVLRGLIGVATEILSKSYNPGADVDSVLDQAEHAVFDISEHKIKPSFHPIKGIIRDSFKTIETLYEKKALITGVSTGYGKIDELTAGLQKSDLIIIAARPSMGKTAFALNIAQHAAIEQNIPVAVFSLEMSKEQLAFRMLASEARVDAQRLRKGFLGEMDWPKLTTAAGRLSEAPIYIDDTPAISALEMKAKSRRLKAEAGLGLIILDYLQLMRGRDQNMPREQEISDISRSLKALAKELNVPLIALSQLNRQVESRSDRRPYLADLRESGAIEQDADVIMFIYRDEVYNKSEDNPERGFAEIDVGKQRNGPVGKVKLTFLKEYTRFENPAWVRDEY